MPRSRHARCIRRAISPRLAMRIFWNMEVPGRSADEQQRLAELDRLPVLDEHGLDHAVLVALDLVHQLHGLDDADRLALLNGVADFDERLSARRTGAVE